MGCIEDVGSRYARITQCEIELVDVDETGPKDSSKDKEEYCPSVRNFQPKSKDIDQKSKRQTHPDGVNKETLPDGLEDCRLVIGIAHVIRKVRQQT